jgi:pyruvate,water dikinase
MNTYVTNFQEIDKLKIRSVGGKGANLGELLRIKGIPVPKGFCVTTGAYKKAIEHNDEINVLLDQLSLLKANDRERIEAISSQIRRIIEGVRIPVDIEDVVTDHLARLGRNCAYAVRSSATSEDLPMASFAGQHETYLNIIGTDSILRHISKCWASLFTDRAVIYRIQNGFDHRKVYLSVVIQQMLFSTVSGIMFTADPVTSNRKVLSIEASFGLGEALVSGLVNMDIYKVREERIVDKQISDKKLAVYALKEGSTEERNIDIKHQKMQTLTDKQIFQLEAMGRKIEAHFGCPQDIEWGLSEDAFFILQSRPVTTLYPIPENDGKNRVYMSVGHHQMMTDAFKPLGMSFIRFLSFWWGENLQIAGGRFFKDITHDLASPLRKIIVSSIGKADVLIENALLSLLKNKGFIKSLPRGKGSVKMDSGGLALIIQAIKIYQKNDISIIENLIADNEALIRDMKQRIKKVSGDELFEFILQDTKELKRTFLDSKNVGALTVWFYASDWINKKMEKWLGEKNAVGVLSQSVANNVTSEMGLNLLEVSDEVRKYPSIIEYLKHPVDETFFENLSKLEGGNNVSDAIQAYLAKYGMRCSGEIDITRSRWSEKPTALIPAILGNIKNFEANARSRKFEQGRLKFEEKERDFLHRLKRLPGGKRKAKKTERMIRVLRNFSGYREYPKYSVMKRFQVYKNALMKEAVKLVQKGVIREKEDVYYLFFEEFREVVNTNHLDYSIISKRKKEHSIFEKLTPPRVMTSEGEIISGEYDSSKTPEGAFTGIPVSSGIIEGCARVILKSTEARLEEDDILVTIFTDPSWTPLFLSAKGLVTEVGGLNTHGAVIAREYGLPAVVGVKNATELIKDGQRIRVNGTQGYVEIL